MIDYKNYTGYKDADPNKIREDMRDGEGRQKTEALFEEAIHPTTRKNGHKPFYSLREYENNGKPSAYQIYINSVDEADAAKKLVGSYQHWRKLCSLKWFVNGRPEAGFEGISRWRLDMAERDKTLAKHSLMTQVLDGNVTASKALHKMAMDEEKSAYKILPKNGKNTKNSEDDSEIIDFLKRHNKEK